MRPAREWHWDRIIPWFFIVGMGAFIAFAVLFIVTKTLIYAF